MSNPAPIPENETGFDTVLGFTLPARSARGRIVRLGPVLDTVLSVHDYPTAIRHLLADALVLTALIGSLMKEQDAQLTIQAQGKDAIVDLLVCDWLNGEIRGYVRHDADKLASLGRLPSLTDLLGKGYLAITFDLAASHDRYQGIVPIEAATLAEACERYFAQSEQIPTLLRTGVHWDGRRCVAGGILIQHLAEPEEGGARLSERDMHPEWEHVCALASTLGRDELINSNLSLETLIWRLFHEETEVRVESLATLSRGCRCSASYYQSVLQRFSEADLAEMRDEDGLISVDCAFCSRVFRIEVNHDN